MFSGESKRNIEKKRVKFFMQTNLFEVVDLRNFLMKLFSQIDYCRLMFQFIVYDLF